MKMVKAVVRPEKATEVLETLNKEGFVAASRISILGRGRQRGLKVGDVIYDEIPKEMIMMVIEDKDLDKVEKILVESARTSKEGAFGDGKIFVLPVEKAVTISTGEEKL
ncbi:MAG: P-II family nitrogen regulator [Treponema sp.]|nr:P-II family nitrogen regulator [Treponema sp.]